MPRVTVGMPVYNSNPGYFRSAIESLLGQTYGDFEILLCDNASNDESQALYQEYAARDRRIRYSRHAQNRGAIFNFNHVVKLGDGEYFKWAADDDIHAPTFLAETVALLDAHPQAVTSSSEMTLVDDDGGWLVDCAFSPQVASSRLPRRLNGLMAKHVYMDIYALHRAAAIRRVREQRAIFGADYVLVFELLLQGPIVRSRDQLFHHRMHLQRQSEVVAKRLVAEHQAPAARRGIWRALVRELLAAVAHARLSPLEKAVSLGVLGGVLARRGRGW